MSWKDFLHAVRRDADATQRAQGDDDVDDELLFHLRSLVDENISRGMSHEEAWNDAQKRFGPLRRYWVECRRATLARRRFVPGLLAGGAVVLCLVVGWLTWEVRSLRHEQEVAQQDAKIAERVMALERMAGHSDLVGQVFDSRGKPIGGTDVFVILKTWPGGWFRQDNFATKSNAQGRFRLEKLIPPTGQFAVQVAALKDGYALTSSYQLKKADDDHAPEPVVLRMNDALALTLVVNDARGRPVPNARVVPSVRRSADGEEHLLYFQGSERAQLASNAAGRVPLRFLQRGDRAKIYVRLPEGEWKLHAIEVPREGDLIEVSATETAGRENAETSKSRPRLAVRMASMQSGPPDRETWAEKLAGFKPGNSSQAFSTGQLLAVLPPDDGYAILEENWHRIGSVRARQQILKAWVFTMPGPLRARYHPRLLDVLNLGMHDGPEVRDSAIVYLRRVALRDFSQDAAAYEAWYEANRARPLPQITEDAARRFVADLVTLEDMKRSQRLLLFRDAEDLFRDDMPEARRAAIDAGLVKTVEQWVTAGMAPQASRAAVETAEGGLRLLAALELPEAELRRVVVPLTSKETPSGMRAAAISALKRQEFSWAVDVLLDALQETVVENDFGSNSVIQEAASALGEIGDPRAIPPMIAVIEARNRLDGICSLGLGKLTGVSFNQKHDGAWWRAWWERNKGRYPAVSDLEIPKLTRASGALPPDAEFDILDQNWPKIGPTYARQKILKSWFFRRHPRLLDALNLGMHDVPEVQSWALDYLRRVTMQDFSDDFTAYEAWWESNRDKPRCQIAQESALRFVAHAAKIKDVKDAQNNHWRDLVYGAQRLFRHTPEARQAAIDTGLVKTIEQWTTAGMVPGAGRDAVETAEHGLRLLAALKLPEAELRRVVVPLISKETPTAMRAAAISALDRQEFPWTVDLLLDVLAQAVAANERDSKSVISQAAGALAEIGEPRAIPLMIAVIEADSTNYTIYRVGWFGLARLTGVPFDEQHDGAWWRAWWEKNKERYPGVSDTQIPVPRKVPAKEVSYRAPSDVADVPSQDLRAGGDPKKRYFLIGEANKEGAPEDGYKLLFVLPGGDGSADFHPFVQRIYKNVLGEEWLIAEPVAPEWDKKQFERITWPTAKSRYPAAKFTTEAFIAAILKDVRSKVKLDSRAIFMLGWSSGGPPVYATTVTRKSPIVGAFVAMSIFLPSKMPALEGAKDKAFYLLQSPDDQVTKILFAERAEKSLQAAGAKVKLERYPGGHGWRGNVFGMLRDGIGWLEQNAAAVN